MWLFDRTTDLAAFGGSALLGVLAWLLMRATGLDTAETPAWGFFLLVVCVDVAHVWATAWRVYLDVPELQRRKALYVAGPVLTWIAGVLLYAAGAPVFWRALAYLAVFHFIRQQYGFMAWYRRKAGEPAGWRAWLDAAAIYAATLGPMVWWHAHLPLPFHWFVDGDFVSGLPARTGDVALVVEACILVAYAASHLGRAQPQPWGKHLLVSTTAFCWWLGIVQSGGDLTFTVVNILPHGVPYVVLCHRYAQGRSTTVNRTQDLWSSLLAVGWTSYLLLLVLVAYVEETLWDAAVWHDHPGLFLLPEVDTPEAALVLLVPLLALPQAWHYALDGFIWRGGPANPFLGPAMDAAARR